jgi:hypothetical protein
MMGNFANSKPCVADGFNYELKTLTNAATPFELFTDADAEMWVLFGTDSGFEGTTTIYFVSGKIVATPLVSEPAI